MSLELSASNEELREQFYAMDSFNDLAKILDVDIKTLRYYVFARPIAANYTDFKISKSSGGFRKIAAPDTNLKIIQQKLNQVFQAVYAARLKPSVHGFVYDRSIVTNAHPHVNSRYILNIDIRNFFPSITFRRVRGLFHAKPYSFSWRLAETLATIVCYKQSLPQGAPTSPVISNMICFTLDSQLQRLAKKHGCFYTRYADDISFSTNRLMFPTALAVRQNTDSGRVTYVGTELNSIIEDNGFEINNDKVRLQSRFERQEVTGLIVNEFTNVRREYINQLRAMLHAWRKYGYDKAEEEYVRKYYRPDSRNPYIKKPISFKHVVRGKIEFVGSVRGKTDDIYLKYLYQYNELIDENFTRPESNPSRLKNLPYIFMSYSRKDQAFAKWLHKTLTNLGAEIWFDQHSIRKGSNWSESVQLGLETAQIMLLIVSPYSMESKNVRDEWQYFLEHSKPIIPLQLHSAEMPYQIRQIQHIDFTVDYESGLSEVIEALREYENPR